MILGVCVNVITGESSETVPCRTLETPLFFSSGQFAKLW